MDIQTLIMLQILFDLLLIIVVIFFFRHWGSAYKIENLQEIREIISTLDNQIKERDEISQRLINEIDRKKKEIKDLLISLELKEKNILKNASINDPYIEAPRYLRQGYSISETAQKVGLPEEDIRLIFELISK